MRKKRLHAFGDSFTFGEIEMSYCAKHFPEIIKKTMVDKKEGSDCFTVRYFPNLKDWDDYKQFANENSFIGLIAKEYDFELKMYAYPGSSNAHQFLKLMNAIGDDHIKSEDVIFMGMTTVFRDIDKQSTLLDKNNYRFESTDNLLALYYEHICKLMHLSTKYKILTLNAFSNPLSFVESNEEMYGQTQERYRNLNSFFNPNFFVGWHTISNTLVDMLIDNYENKQVDRTIDTYLKNKYGGPATSHTKINLSEYLTFIDKAAKKNEYKDLFQPRMHPTFKGHQKIFQKLKTIIEREHEYFIR